jgi:hypothetical protein
MAERKITGEMRVQPVDSGRAAWNCPDRRPKLRGIFIKV